MLSSFVVCVCVCPGIVWGFLITNKPNACMILEVNDWQGGYPMAITFGNKKSINDR